VDLDFRVALQTTVIGMGIVFFTLFVLSIIIRVLKWLSPLEFEGRPQWHRYAPEEIEPTQEVAAADDDSISPEVVAAIAAALTCYYGGREFPLAAIRRIVREDGGSWAEAGRHALMNSRINTH